MSRRKSFFAWTLYPSARGEVGPGPRGEGPGPSLPRCSPVPPPSTPARLAAATAVPARSSTDRHRPTSNSAPTLHGRMNRTQNPTGRIPTHTPRNGSGTGISVKPRWRIRHRPTTKSTPTLHQRMNPTQNPTGRIPTHAARNGSHESLPAAHPSPTHPRRRRYRTVIRLWHIPGAPVGATLRGCPGRTSGQARGPPSGQARGPAPTRGGGMARDRCQLAPTGRSGRPCRTPPRPASAGARAGAIMALLAADAWLTLAAQGAAPQKASDALGSFRNRAPVRRGKPWRARCRCLPRTCGHGKVYPPLAGVPLRSISKPKINSSSMRSPLAQGTPPKRLCPSREGGRR